MKRNWHFAPRKFLHFGHDTCHWSICSRSVPAICDFVS